MFNGLEREREGERERERERVYSEELFIKNLAIPASFYFRLF
ncbi:hypothetical protein [Cylindrospermopsis raciborskii]|nr:hypothetical protein [Cylindrospermopsis raciborskii]MCZ2207984.1 hypothetical protein [Cylindrospermopsis raciborskii PAMP2011]